MTEGLTENAIQVRDVKGKVLGVVCSARCSYQVEGAEDSRRVVTFGGTCMVCESKLLP